MSDKTLELVDTATGKKAVLPVRSGTIGPSVVDIAPMVKEFGAFTYDPGYGATAAVESKITYIDGEAGVLMHRGYPIEQLADEELVHRGLLSTAERRPAEQAAARSSSSTASATTR